MARLGADFGPAKELAQVGAAIGREFSHFLLTAVVRKPEMELQTALDRLIGAGLLLQQGSLRRPRPTFSSMRWYGMRLTARCCASRDVRFMPRMARKPSKVGPGHVLEKISPSCWHQLTEAGLIEKAAALWGKAGLRSAQRSALVEASEQLRRALDQIDPDRYARPPSRRNQASGCTHDADPPCQRLRGAGNQGRRRAGTSADRTS